MDLPEKTEFDKLRARFIRETAYIQANYDLLKFMQKTEGNLSSINVLIDSLYKIIIINLAKLYFSNKDKKRKHTSLSVNQILDYVTSNPKLFKKNLKKEILKDRIKFDNNLPKLRNLKKQRNKLIAHIDLKHLDIISTVDKYPIKDKQLKSLLNDLVKFIKVYSVAYDNMLYDWGPNIKGINSELETYFFKTAKNAS